jgi:hypothetical protein
MPDHKRRGQDDQPVLGEGGKPVWDPVLEFRDRAARDRFGAIILEALRVASRAKMSASERAFVRLSYIG